MTTPAIDGPLAIVERRLADWPTRVRDAATTPRLSGDAIRQRLAKYDFRAPHALDLLLTDVVSLLEQGTVHSTHPRYFGLFNPGVLPAGVAADGLAALYNPQVGAWWHAPAANEIERLTLAFFQERLGIAGPDASATFTTGGSEANLTGVLAALTRGFPTFIDDGVRSLDRQPVLYVSDQAHDSFVKIAGMTGLGRSSVRRVASDVRHRIDPEALRRSIAADRASDRAPFLLVGTAGTTGTGAIDPLNELATICWEEGLWYHVDAAWGGLAALSDALRPLLTGIERADSVTLDAHKVLPVPMGAGMFFSRLCTPLEAAFAVHTGYVPDREPGTSDAYQYTVQWSRRFIGLKVFVTLAELGADGVAALVEHQTAMGDLLRAGITRAGWRLMNDSRLPLVCFIPDAGASPAAIARAVSDEGAVWLSELRLTDGTSALRACITHHETGPGDVEALLKAVARAAKEPAPHKA